MQAQIEKTKLVIGKIKGDDSDTEEDGFIDALKGKVAAAWNGDEPDQADE